MPTRTTRSTTSRASTTRKTRSENASAPSSRSRKRPVPKAESEESDSANEQIGEEDDGEEDGNDADSINSDNLDDEDDDYSSNKRKRAPQSPVKGKAKASPRKQSSPRKKRKTAVDEDDVEDDDLSDVDLQEGQEIVGRVIQAPTAGRVPPGQISQNTLDFLSQLKNPECNDREWFKLHEPIYRLAEKEWKDFVESFTDVLVAADPQIPHLPPKDVTHRIYRDVRFSNDKTPYKTGFSASFSRSGRKGIFAKYHVSISPGRSLIAAGTWCPGKNELATIRNNLLRSSTRFRKIISSPTFAGLFGEAKPDAKGGERNIFGREDELKVAPKGVPKDHKDIDILKCRSHAVVYHFTDKQVLQPDFKEELGRFIKILRPFVHCLNDLMTIQDADSDDDDEEDEDEEGEEEEEEEEAADLVVGLSDGDD